MIEKVPTPTHKMPSVEWANEVKVNIKTEKSSSLSDSEESFEEYESHTTKSDK